MVTNTALSHNIYFKGVITHMKFKIKIIISLVIWSIYTLLLKLYYPILNNSTAVSQLNDTNESFINYNLNRQLFEWTSLGLVCFTIILFVPDLIKFIKNRITYKKS